MSTTTERETLLWRVRITPRSATLDAHGAAMLRDVHDLGLPHVECVASSRLFLLQGPIAEENVRQIGSALLGDPVTETLDCCQGGDDDTLPGQGFDACVEVRLKGGVMDTVAASTLAALADMGMATDHLTVATARVYQLEGVKSRDELEFIARRLLFNDCIEEVYLTGLGQHDPRPDHLPIAPRRAFELKHVEIRSLNDTALRKLSREGHLFLSLEEMRTIQDYYRGQDRDPTDLELETFAQTWSEHCVHKTLKSAVRYEGAPLPPTSAANQKSIDSGRAEIVYDNLLTETVARATYDLIDSGRVDWCLSVFEDNAGVIRFDDDYGIAFKVETHNHPSAIEPYGGAATGIGGVIRDILGCGLGAKPIANTDVFCVGQPDFPMTQLPKGVLHPRRILKGIVRGVRDYGNRMGIPTVNGAILFDDRYLGNPLVFCGCIGLIPHRCIHKEPQPGDLVVVIGGRTGRDGIHGATFSSAELTDTHAEEFSHAVQIGDAITEKKVTDAMMQARDHASGCLYNATTDCGAGGLSSAVGEMGEKLGAEVDLEKVPLKYAGLRYDEIWISEAQERMVFSVPPAKWDTFRAICDAENVEATAIGQFRNDGKLILRYQSKTVGEIDVHFLHNGVPGTQKSATWSPEPSEPQSQATGSTEEILLAKLSDLNTASKEWVIRQYDHEVQGASVVKPLTGPGEGPSDAAVIRPRLDTRQGLAIACGISCDTSDPYWMAVAGIDEAIRNIVCVGGDPRRTAILDNFCWGNCEDSQTMGAMVRACQGCYDAAVAYGTPFVSGKDSLNNEFSLDPADAKVLADRIKLYNNRIRIPETLLISTISLIDDVKTCVTMDAKRIEGGSHFFFVGLEAKSWSEVDMAKAATLHQSVADAIRTGKVLAAHDCGDEGILPALAEMAFAGQCGLDVDFESPGPFDPIPCGYILQVAGDHDDVLVKLSEFAQDEVIIRIGQTRNDDKLCRQGDDGFEIDVKSLSDTWRSTLDW